MEPTLKTPPTIRGLQTVRVNKEAVLERIKQNREEHRKIFEEALSGWKAQVTKALEEAYQDALRGKDYRVRIGLVKPEDHTDDYDQVIEMLELSLDDELELTYSEFRQYVMDEWGWQQQFLATTSSYSETARGKFNS